MKNNRLKNAKAITLIALIVTIIVLLILAGISIAALTGNNGVLNNASIASTKNAYEGAEEKVKIAYTAVRTEIMAKTVESGTYNPASPENTRNLANIVRKDLGLAENDTNGNGTWKVDDTTAGVIKIEYRDSKIDQGVMGLKTITKLGDLAASVAIPREEGVVHYQINLLEEQNAKLYVDVMTDIEPVHPTSIDISSEGDATSIEVDDTLQFYATPHTSSGNPTTDTIVWNSSDESVATIDENGLVTALAAGTTNITAIARDGEGNHCTSQPFTLTVNSSAPVIPEGHEILPGVTNRVTYGKYVNYNIDLGIGTANDVTDDWRVFYDDGTNIYIIAADYVPVSNSYLATAITNMGATAASIYGVYWPSGGFQSYQYKNGTLTKDTATGAADIFATNAPAGTKGLVEKGFLGYWKNAMNGTMSNKYNAKMTASLMDTKVWEGFAGGIPSGVLGTLPNDNKTAYAIGGPTLSMFVESWNKTKTTKLYYNRASSTGYYVKAGSQPSTSDTYADLSSNTDYTNASAGDLYFPRKSDISNCYGYWLASPSANGTGNEMGVYYSGGVYDIYYDDDYYGVRPVVCLPSSVTLTQDTNNANLYNISTN